MWHIFEKKTVQKKIKKAPVAILKRYEAWKRIIETSGPQALKHINGFNDEALKGQWRGYRSSRLGLQWRVIYKVKNDVLEVYVFEVNPHKY